MRGYSLHIVEALKNADSELPWVKLGLICVDRGIPVDTVARILGVSRQAVYSWFSGRYTPSTKTAESIVKFLSGL
jgi:DNA-binding phage protein